MMIRRGDIYYADLSPVVGSEQGGIRPVLVIQNNVGNRHSPTVICAAITSKMNKAKLPTHIEISTRDYKIVKRPGDQDQPGASYIAVCRLQLYAVCNGPALYPCYTRSALQSFTDLFYSGCPLYRRQKE